MRHQSSSYRLRRISEVDFPGSEVAKCVQIEAQYGGASRVEKLSAIRARNDRRARNDAAVLEGDVERPDLIS